MCESLTERGFCGHSGPGQRDSLIPVAEDQGVGLGDGLK